MASVEVHQEVPNLENQVVPAAARGCEGLPPLWDLLLLGLGAVLWYLLVSRRDGGWGGVMKSMQRCWLSLIEKYYGSSCEERGDVSFVSVYSQA